MIIAQQEISNRLSRLMQVMEWVLTDVTASIDEKLEASRDHTQVEELQMFVEKGCLTKNDLEWANAKWEYYTDNLTGSNVPQHLLKMTDI